MDSNQGLDKICFAPLATSNSEPNIDLCTIQSFYGYFQNDMAKFNKNKTDANGIVTNYLDVLYSCML